MQYLFKYMLVAVITTLGVALTVMPAHAQSDSRAIVDIPFDFLVGNTTLKAGSYRVEQLQLQLQSQILSLSSSDGKVHHFAMTLPGDSDKQSQKPYLVFIRYGSEVFLKKVFLSANEDCYELPESSRERKLINQAPGAELSLLITPTR